MNDTIIVGSAEHEWLGPLWVALSARGLVAVLLKGSETALRAHLGQFTTVQPVQEAVAPVMEQLLAYLQGEQVNFDIPVDWSVLSPFQGEVLRHVHAIPYGQTRTYGDIALALGNPGAARAVGRANATNPMPLIIPCHRVLGNDGSLHGYAGPGGVETKARLLQLEGSRLL